MENDLNFTTDTKNVIKLENNMNPYLNKSLVGFGL